MRPFAPASLNPQRLSMSRDKVRLGHILESITLIQSYVRNVDEKGFAASVGIQDQVIRRFEIIGEAARRLSSSLRQQFTTVEWPKLISMRNFLTNDYDVNDLPTLAAEIQAYL